MVFPVSNTEYFLFICLADKLGVTISEDTPEFIEFRVIK